MAASHGTGSKVGERFCSPQAKQDSPVIVNEAGREIDCGDAY
jgi:hypothetical protein